MQTAYKRLSVITGFGLLLVLLIANALITRRQLGVQIDSQAWVAHSRQVLYELSQTESLLKDAETGQRGFLYTGDPKYLNPYAQAVGQVQPHIDSLARLTADNPRERAQIPQLRDLTQKKTSELAQTIALYKAGKLDEAKTLVLSDAGLLYMDKIRLLIVQMEGEEDSLDSERTARYKASIQKTIASIYLTSLLAVVGLSMLAYYILRQIELREKHARELRTREEWFRVTLTSIGDAVIATDPEGIVTFLNPVAEALTGTTLALAKGKRIEQIFPIFNEVTLKAVENPVKKVMAQGIVVGLANHTVLQHTDGRMIPIEDSAAPIRDDRQQLLGVVLVFRDVTHERKSEEFLRKTEKLASAARLSATVAHEINNPLEALTNLLYLAQTSDNFSDVRDFLLTAERELRRVSAITSQTLRFHKQASSPQAVAAASLIDSILTVYQGRAINTGVVIERRDRATACVNCFDGEIRQVISNLFCNALEAMGPERRRILIRSREATHWRTGERGVVLTMADTGVGMGPEILARIFKPFFTTKSATGTGLGLWVSKEIVDRHRGAIAVRSSNDPRLHGSVFTLFLPFNAVTRKNR